MYYSSSVNGFAQAPPSITKISGMPAPYPEPPTLQPDIEDPVEFKEVAEDTYPFGNPKFGDLSEKLRKFSVIQGDRVLHTGEAYDEQEFLDQWKSTNKYMSYTNGSQYLDDTWYILEQLGILSAKKAKPELIEEYKPIETADTKMKDFFDPIDDLDKDEQAVILGIGDDDDTYDDMGIDLDETPTKKPEDDTVAKFIPAGWYDEDEYREDCNCLNCKEYRAKNNVT